MNNNINWFKKDILPFFKTVIDIECVDKLDNMGFFTAPASAKYHGAYRGGLFEHSYVVTKSLVDLTKHECLKWSRPESPYIVGMFHDLCKCDLYIPIRETPVVKHEGTVITTTPITKGYRYNNECLLKGHGDKSVMLASTLLSLTEEEIMCIRYHMGAFTDKEEWNDYTRAIHRYPNVLWTHTADMVTSQIKGV